MKTLLWVAAALTVAAAEPDARIWRLVPPETVLIIGVDVPRYSATRLAGHYQLPLENLVPAGVPVSAIHQLVHIETGAKDPLDVIFGAFATPHLEPEDRRFYLSPEPGVLLAGSSGGIQTAARAWARPNAAAPEWAPRVRSLSRDNDNWLWVRDLAASGLTSDFAAPGIPWKTLQGRVREAQFGLRAGRRHELSGTVEMASAADATLLLTLVHFLPALLRSTGLDDDGIMNLATNFGANRQGATIELSASIDDARIPAPRPRLF